MPSSLWERALSARVTSALAGVAAAVGSLRAQSPDTAQFRCEGKTITGIEIESQPPAIVGRDPSAIRRAEFAATTARRSPAVAAW
jgi:hypothetical protein